MADEIPTIELLYLCDDDFKRGVDGIRKKFGISTNEQGFVSSSNFINFDGKLIKDEELYSSYVKEVETICEEYSLQESRDDMEMFIESGITPYTSMFKLGRIKKGPIRVGLGKGITNPTIRPRRKDAPKMFGAEVKFIIRHYINQRDLERWFDKYKSKILVEANDSFRGFVPSITKTDKLARVIEIIRLREKDGLKYREIADKICNELPEDPDVINGKVNEQSIKMIYSRYKSRFKK